MYDRKGVERWWKAEKELRDGGKQKRSWEMVESGKEMAG